MGGIRVWGIYIGPGGLLDGLVGCTWFGGTRKHTLD